jgi:uncharacterized membrane protein YbhN (UPF0104 family)
VTPRAGAVLRLGVSAGLLAVVATQVAPAAIVERLAALDGRWLVPAFALTVVQVLASAWRWRYTAARLGLPLPLGVAVREYYLATFVNQVLPGGVLGDVGRAGRHGAAEKAYGPAGRAVLLERASGQAAFAVLAAGALAVAPFAPPWGLPAAAIVILGATAAISLGSRRRPAGEAPGPWGVFVGDAQRALVADGAWRVQLALSLAIALSYVAVYALAGLALGTPAPGTWLPLVPLVLLAMLVPVSVAGWGVREGAAAAAWAAAGLSPADGAALAIIYGLVVLVSSLPGLAVALWPMPGPRGPAPDAISRAADDGRTGRRAAKGKAAGGEGRP